MKKVLIDLENYKYDVYIGDTISYLPKFVDGRKVFVITDENVKNLHLKTLNKMIKFDYLYVLGKDAESSKNLMSYELCLKYALDNYIDKDTLIIGFGGGSVTDFAGFFASTYKRGLDIVLLPTTILSHDSAIGGKTALNYGLIKNVVGSFYQPKVVIFHLPFLKTISKEEIISGFGEILKHDLLADGYLINEVLKQERLDEVIFDEKLMEEIIYRAIIVKKLYVEMDVYETEGKRQFLNFGHTLGHGLEITNHLSHGEAISLGMCFDMFISGNDYYLTFYQKLKKWGFFNNNINFNNDEVVDVIKNDKKNKQGKIKFIGLKQVGRPFEIYLTSEQLKDKLEEFKRLIL